MHQNQRTGTGPKKKAVQLLNKVLSKESSSEVIDSFVLRNSQLLLGAKCYKTLNSKL